MIGILDDTAPAPPAPSRAPELAARAFSETGWLQEKMGLEHRPGQERMANAAAAAFRGDTPLLFEAGTGIGKSLAYLVPGIIHASDCGRQMIVSTNTISLQEQIEKKDLPLCRRLFTTVPELGAYASFASAVLVGKSNYLCTSRLSHALAERASLFDDAGYAELQRIADWADSTQTGLRHELQPPPSPEVWESVNADSSSCSRRNCDCEPLLLPARTGARALGPGHRRQPRPPLLAHQRRRRAGGGRRPRRVRASSSPATSSSSTRRTPCPRSPRRTSASSLSSLGVERTLKHLYNPKTPPRDPEEARRRGASARGSATRSTPRCSSSASSRSSLLAERPDRAHPRGGRRRAAPVRAARSAGARPRQGSGQARGRARARRAPRAEGPRALHPGRRRRMAWALGQGPRLLGREGRQEADDRDAAQRPDRTSRPSWSAASSAPGSASSARARRSPPAARWRPFAARHRRGAGARPRSRAPPSTSSATCGSMSPADIPLPSPQDSRTSIDALADYVGFCCERVAGGSLVLFTSYRDMQAVAAVVEPRLARRRAARSSCRAATSRGRSSPSGCATSATPSSSGPTASGRGSTCPGDALSQVVIARLPFSPPTHPIAEAKSELIRDRGGDPFNELTLPEALIKFRQGAGRLIRTKTDRGPRSRSSTAGSSRSPTGACSWRAFPTGTSCA